MKWPLVQLQKLADVSGGSTPRRKRPEYWNGSIPWLTPTDLPMPGERLADVYDTADHITEEGLNSCAASLLPVGTVLFSSRATIGKIGIARVPLATNQGFANFTPRPGVHSKYLAYALQYLTNDISALAGSTTFKEVRRGLLKKYKVPLPAYSEQYRIAEILERGDALRKQRVEANEKAQGILPALFYRTFGDPARNPNQWPTVTIRDIVESIERRNPEEGPAPSFTYIDISGVDGEHGAIVETRDILGKEAPSRARQVVSVNDVIISTVRPYLRATALVPHHLNGQICSTGFCVLRAKRGRGFGFLYALSRLTWFTQQLNARARGASYPAVTDKDILDLTVPRPEAPQMHEFFDNQVLCLLALHQQQKRIAATLESLFESLLHRALTGDLTAQWREAHMKELLVEMQEQAKLLQGPEGKEPVRAEKVKRHAGHDMYNKAALAAYIAHRCYSEDRPLGRVKLAKLFYLAQRKAELQLTEEFALRAAGPVDDDMPKFLSLARKQKWVILGRGQGSLKPVRPGKKVAEGAEQAVKLLGAAKEDVEDMLGRMKDWGWRALERWATVLHAAEGIADAGAEVSVPAVEQAINEHPEWQDKLDRDEFSETNLASTLKGLRDFGLLSSD